MFIGYNACELKSPLDAGFLIVDKARGFHGDAMKTIHMSYEIKATSTVVVANAKTGKHVNLVGENEISCQAITEVGK